MTKTKTKSAPRAANAAPAEETSLLTGWRALGIYFLLAVVYFFPAFLPDRHVYGSDYIGAAYFYHEWISALFGAGEIPKWLPYVYGGLPWFANPGMTWYPFRFLADLVLPVSGIFPAIYVIQATVAGFGTYLLARELGARRWVALVAGLAFQFTGQLMSFTLAGHDGRMIGMSSGPLFLFFLARGIRTGRVGPFAGASATIGFAMLSFQIQTAYYVLLAGALWSLFLLLRQGWHRKPRPLARRVALGLGAVALGFAMNAVNFLPFLDYVDQSPRGGGGRGYDYAVQYSMAPEHVLSMAVPEQHGLIDAYQARIMRLMQAGIDVSGENTFKLHTEYVGAVVLGLFLLGFLYCRRDPRWWFFVGLTVFAFTIAFGGNTPLYRLYYAVLPGTRMFRTPDIGYIMVPMALVAIAALVLERLAALRDARTAPGVSRRRAPDDDGAPSFTVAVAVLGALALIAVVAAPALGHARTAALGAPLGWLRFGMFAALLAVAFWLWLGERIGTRGFAVALALLTVVDLWIIDRQFFRTVEPVAQMFAADDVARFLEARQAEEGVFRVWVLPPNFGVRSYHLHDNYLMRFDIQQASGEHGNQLQRWNEYLGAGEEVYTDYHNFIADLQQAAQTGDPTQYMGAGNIRYVVSMAQLPLPGWRLVHEGPSALIYENPAATPRAWLVPEVEVVTEADAAPERMLEPGWEPLRTAFVYDALPAGLGTGALQGDAAVTSYEQDRIVVRATASRPALLVLADNYYEGWDATVDGADTPILRVNHTFRGVVVPAGEHEVVFTFRPAGLMAGLWIYLAVLAALAAYGAWAAWIAWREPRGEPAPA